jgi:hypothetical protein
VPLHQVHALSLAPLRILNDSVRRRVGEVRKEEEKEEGERERKEGRDRRK